MIRELEIRTSREQPIVVTIVAVRYERGDDRHLLVPFLHSLSHSLPIFLVFPSSNSDSEEDKHTWKIESLLLVGEFG